MMFKKFFRLFLFFVVVGFLVHFLYFIQIMAPGKATDEEVEITQSNVINELNNNKLPYSQVLNKLTQIVTLNNLEPTQFDKEHNKKDTFLGHLTVTSKGFFITAIFIFFQFTIFVIAFLMGGWVKFLFGQISDILFSVPTLFIIPASILLLEIQNGELNIWSKYLMAGFFLSFRPSILLSQIYINNFIIFKKQHYSRTWFSFGGGDIKFILTWSLPSLMVSLIQIMPQILVHLISGSVLVETLFRLPGMGYLFVQSLQYRDWDLIWIYVLLIGSLIYLFQWMADELVQMLDPRLKMSYEE